MSSELGANDLEKCVDKKKKKKKLASDVPCKSAALLKQLEVNSFTLSEFKKKTKKNESYSNRPLYIMSHSGGMFMAVGIKALIYSIIGREEHMFQ